MIAAFSIIIVIEYTTEIQCTYFGTIVRTAMQQLNVIRFYPKYQLLLVIAR